MRPDIIYCNTYMYGAIGPLAHFGGVDPLAQAAAGLEWEQGPVAEGNPPLWYRYGHGDAAGAMTSVTAVLIALYHRNQTGEGHLNLGKRHVMSRRQKGFGFRAHSVLQRR